MHSGCVPPTSRILSNRYLLVALVLLVLLLLLRVAPARAAGDCPTLPQSGVLTLAAAAERLRACNADILTARAAVEAARGDRVTADHWPNPTLGLSVSNINPRAGIGNGSLADRTVDQAIRLDQVFERGGKRTARRTQAAATLDAAQAALADAGLRSEQDLVEAWMDVLEKTRDVELLQQAAQSYEQSSAAMERRLAAGDVARIEVNRTALDAARAAADAEAARRDLAAARSALALLLAADALPADLQLVPIGVSGSTPPAPPADEPEIDARPDVRAARANLAAAEAQVALARAARVRDVDVNAGFDHWPISATNPLGTGNSYTIGISVPLFVFEDGSGALQHALAERARAAVDATRVVNEARAQRALAHDGFLRAAALAERYRSYLLPASDSILQAEEVAYRRGGASLLDLLDARRNARQVALAANAAQHDRDVAAARELTALGRSPLEAFDRTPTQRAADSP
jgi:cobalt-zinc-cadmium efflux system outer membrane protein